MKKNISILVLIFLFAGFAFAQSDIVNAETYASYYAEPFHGRPTANGETFDMNAYTAAHKTLPFGTMVEVTNLENGKKVIVRINDRGPFVAEREIDLSKAAAASLDMLSRGVVRVSIRIINNDNAAAFGTQNTNNAGNTYNPYQNTNHPGQNPNTMQDQMQPKYQEYKSLVYTPVNASETSGPLWRIQLGSFTREENAMRLVVQLRKIGFEPAYEKTETHIRVVLYGIIPSDLEKVKDILSKNNIKDYILRQESW